MSPWTGAATLLGALDARDALEIRYVTADHERELCIDIYTFLHSHASLRFSGSTVVVGGCHSRSSAEPCDLTIEWQYIGFQTWFESANV